MQVLIREMERRDVPAIAALLHALVLAHNLDPPPAEQLRRSVEQVAAAPDARYLVAEAAGAIVGTLQVNRRYSTWAGRHYGYVEDFCVAEEWRGRGVGAALLAHVEQLGRAAGWARIDLDVETGNAAIRLYQRAGFHSTGAAIYRKDLG